MTFDIHALRTKEDDEAFFQRITKPYWVCPRCSMKEVPNATTCSRCGMGRAR
jgi:ribosomal protein L40E